MKNCRSCPFCGCKGLRMNGHKETQYYVVCKACNAYGPSADTIEEAKKVWNARWVNDQLLL